VTLAWVDMAEGKPADALKRLDGIEQAALAEPGSLFGAFAPLQRAAMLVETGKHDDAIKHVERGLANGVRAEIPGQLMGEAHAIGYAIRVTAELELGKTADAEKTLAALAAEAQRMPMHGDLKSALHYATGAVALAKGDAKLAAVEMAQCDVRDIYCRWRLIDALEQGKDTAGADQARQALKSANLRDAFYAYVRTKLK
jgi:hypothetical protein